MGLLFQKIKDSGMCIWNTHKRIDMETWYPKFFIRHKIGKETKNAAPQHNILYDETNTANMAMRHNA
jgi:hypothetical protein